MSEWIRRRERALFDEGEQTIGEIMELYFANRLREGKSVAKEQRLWRANMATLFADRKPDDLNMPVEVDGEERTLPHKYAWARAQAGIRRATIHHELNILRTGINWAIKQKMIAPVAVWLPRRAKPRDTRMTFEELLRLLDECNAVHLKLFVILAISTGARKTAILQLTWDRVDLDRRVINFNVDRDQDNILDSSGRKGRAVVDMEEAAHQALTIAKRWRTTEHVIEWNGKPVKDVHQALKRAMVRAGIDGKFFGAHAIRHSVATMIADAGVDLRKVQRLLGHEDFSTTDKIYAAHSRGYLSDAVRVVDGFLPKMEPDAELGSGEILEGGTKKHVEQGSSNLRPKQ
jgi:integrase